MVVNTVMSHSQEQPAFHYHPGFQILGVANVVTDDMRWLTEPALIGTAASTHVQCRLSSQPKSGSAVSCADILAQHF